MFSRYTNQYKKPEEGTLSKLMGGFDNKPVEKSLGLEVDKPSFAVDATLGQLPPKGPPALDPSPTEQPSEAGEKKGWQSNAWDKTKDFFGAEVVGGEDSAPRVEEGLGHKIMNYALPALMSLGGGAGILPGLMSGMAKSAKGRQQEMETSTDWQKNKSATDLKQQTIQADKDKTDAMLGLSKRKVDISAGGLALKQKAADQKIAADIQKRLADDPNMVSDKELAWLDKYDKRK